MQEIIYTKGYEGLKEELRAELSKSVESFVRIGYLLKVARDTNVLSESPYSNMEEFAYAEFKIDKGTASKFMNINDRFSENGNSERLKEEYRGIGWSKLTIMLQLPDTANEELSNDFSKAEMQTLREEFAEAEKETPIELALEGETETTEAAEDLLHKVIRQMGESEPEIYRKIHAAVQANYSYDLQNIKSIMAPDEENIYSVRIQGVGRIMLSVKDYEETVVIVNERSGDREKRLWGDVILAWLQIINKELSPKENWEKVFGQQFPKKEEVAPVQPKKESKVKKVNDIKSGKSVPKTEKNVIKTEENVPKPQESVPKPQESVEKKEWEEPKLHDYNPNFPMPDPIEEDAEETQQEEEKIAEVQQDDTPIEGQMCVEDIPEIMPTPVTIGRRDYDERKQSYINSFESNIGCAMANKDEGLWDIAKDDLQDAMRYLDLLIELEGMEVSDEEQNV